MNNVRNILTMLSLASVVAGCAVSVGPGEGVQRIADATQESLQQEFVAGTTTRDDVAMKLGAPTKKSVAGSYEIWNYQYVKRAEVGIVFVGLPIGTTKNATFYFDSTSGVLQKLEFETHQG